jgi:hypothetical protein
MAIREAAKSVFLPKVLMKSLFDTQAYEEILERLHKLDKDLQPQWGKMSAGQMVWHCQIPLKLAIENKASSQRSNPLIRWLFKRSMYSDKPWRKNLPTPPQLKATEPRDFEEEFPKLLQEIHAFHKLKLRENWNPHPMFGRFTPQQWGQMQYKHLDHHLRQFNC